MVDPEAEHNIQDKQRHLSIPGIGRIGHCTWDLVTNDMIWSPGLYSIFQLDPYQGESKSLNNYLLVARP